MKSLDEHLRDASQSWAQEATPTLVSSADAIAKTLRPRSWMSNWGLGTFGLGAILAVGLYLAGSSPGGELLGEHAGEHSGEHAGEHSGEHAGELAGSHAVSPASSPESSPAGSHAVSPESSPAGSHAVSPEGSPAGSHAVSKSSRLRVEGNTDGFTAEYERVLGQAMALESTDPLKAVNEYMGLVRMCERRDKFAHAASALERAAVLAGQIGDVNLKHTIDTKLAEIKETLAP